MAQPFFETDPTGSHSSGSFADKLITWNASNYIAIADSGYTKGSPLCAYYPLLPLLIKGVKAMTGLDSVIVGLLCCNVLSIVGCILFYMFCKGRHGSKTALAALGGLLLFPGAIFFSFIYTESLFFFLIVLFFFSLYRQQWIGVLLAGLLLPLAKAIGVFCVAPLLYWLWSHNQLSRKLWICYAPMVGYGLYFLLMHTSTGNAFEGFDAQGFYATQPSISNIFNLPKVFQAFIQVRTFHSGSSSFLDRMFFVVFLITLPTIWKLDKTYFVYAVFAGGVPALASLFYSYTRNVTMCFPLFIAFAVGSTKLPAAPKMMILSMIAALQIWFIYRHVNFEWAG